MILNDLNELLAERTGYTVRAITDNRNAPGLKMTLGDDSFHAEILLARHKFYGQTPEHAADAIYEALESHLRHRALEIHPPA